MTSYQINPKTFCIGPWAEVRINPDGSMNFCHAADTDMIPQGDQIHCMTVDQYFNTGATVTDARNRLGQGQSLDACHRCYKDEQAGLISFRQRRNLQAAIFPGADFIDSASEAIPRITQWQRPRFYHVSLSNLCNMACMMCDSRWSSLLASTQQRAGILQNAPTLLRDWTQDSGVWRSFVEHLLGNPDIVCLHFMDGEPMYHKRFWELIDQLVERDHCDFALTVVTNGSIFDPDKIRKLQRFRSVVIEISIETLDHSNDYIRYPSRYQAIQQNILHYLGHRSDDFAVVLRSVPQLLSAPGYHTLLSFAHEHAVAIDSNVLHTPAWLALNVLPDDVKQAVSQRLSAFVRSETAGPRDINLRNASDIDHHVSQHVASILQQINQPCLDFDQCWRTLTTYCRKMDRIRGLDVRRILPDLAPWFDQYGYSD